MVSVCIGCGCDDLRACHDVVAGGPCRWVRLDRDKRVGVCSACPEVVEAWDRGDRDVRVPIEARVARHE